MPNPSHAPRTDHAIQLGFCGALGYDSLCLAHTLMQWSPMQMMPPDVLFLDLLQPAQSASVRTNDGMFMHKAPSLVDLVSVQRATEGHMLLGLLPLVLKILHPSWLVFVRSYIQFLEHTEVCARGDPMSTNGASSLTLLQANCLSDSLVKSKP